MRFRKTLTFLILATGLVIALPGVKRSRLLRSGISHIQITAGPQLAQVSYRPPELALSPQRWLRASSGGTGPAR